LAVELKVPAPRINDIVRERRPSRRILRSSPEFWMDLQTAYDPKAAVRDVGDRIEAGISPRTA